MSEPTYAWLCDKCYVAIFRNENFLTKIINPNRIKTRCEHCKLDRVCQACKITSFQELKEEHD